MYENEVNNFPVFSDNLYLWCAIHHHHRHPNLYFNIHKNNTSTINIHAYRCAKEQFHSMDVFNHFCNKHKNVKCCVRNYKHNNNEMSNRGTQMCRINNNTNSIKFHGVGGLVILLTVIYFKPLSFIFFLLQLFCNCQLPPMSRCIFLFIILFELIRRIPP